MAEPLRQVLIAVEQLRRRVPGGIGAYATGLLYGVADSGDGGGTVAVTLLASRAPRHGDRLASFGLPVITSQLPGRLLTRAWDHRLVHAPEGFEIVHSVSLAAPMLRRSSASRLVVTVHDIAWRRRPEATTARGRRWHESALRRACESGAALVVPSRLVAADLTADGVDPARITIVPGGSDHLTEPDPAGADALLKRVGVPGEFLLTVSTLEPRKNVDRLLRAYAQVRPALPEPWPLVIVGPAGWGPELAGSHESAGVVFAGAVPDAVLTELYRRARAFAYVPLTEGYGLPPLEAMRMGSPSVVANEVPSVHDLGQTGSPPARIVDPFDVEDIASGIGDVLTNEAIRADLVARGTEHVRGRTWRAAAVEHIALWRSLA
jgi:glycosyltransferase involved in cell wall biosynthesis